MSLDFKGRGRLFDLRFTLPSRLFHPVLSASLKVACGPLTYIQVTEVFIVVQRVTDNKAVGISNPTSIRANADRNINK